MRYVFFILYILWSSSVHAQDFLKSNNERSPLYGYGPMYSIPNCPWSSKGTFFEQEVADKSKHIYNQNLIFDVTAFPNHKNYIYVDISNVSDSFQMKIIASTDTFIYNKEKLAYWVVQLGEEVFETKLRKGKLQLDTQLISFDVDSIQTKKYYVNKLQALKSTSKIEIILSNNSIKDSIRIICFSMDDNPKNYSLHEIIYEPSKPPLFILDHNDKILSFKDYFAYTSRCHYIGLGDLRTYLFYKHNDSEIYQTKMKKLIATYFHY
jgi:hypothetical protein